MKKPDPQARRLNLRFNPLACDEDINIPIRLGHPAAAWNDEDYMDELENHKLDMRYDPMANSEDFFIPVRVA